MRKVLFRYVVKFLLYISHYMYLGIVTFYLHTLFFLRYMCVCVCVCSEVFIVYFKLHVPWSSDLLFTYIHTYIYMCVCVCVCVCVCMMMMIMYVFHLYHTWRVFCCSCFPTTFFNGLFIAWRAVERFYAEGFGFLFDNTSCVVLVFASLFP